MFGFMVEEGAAAAFFFLRQKLKTGKGRGMSADVQLTLHGFLKEKGRAGGPAGGQARLLWTKPARLNANAVDAFGFKIQNLARSGKYYGI